MLFFVLALMGAIPEPRYDVEQITLTQSETEWLIDARIEYERDAYAKVRDIGTRIAEAERDIVELEAERDATEDQAARDAIDAEIAALKQVAIDSRKRKQRKVYSEARPSAADARRVSLAVIYDADTGTLKADANEDGFLTKAEIGWPKFVIDDIDANADNKLTAAEIAAYLGGL